MTAATTKAQSTEIPSAGPSAPPATWTPPTFWKPTKDPLTPAGRLLRSVLWHPVRLYTRLELPKFGHLINWWGVSNARQWIDAPTLTGREKFHGYTMRLDLSDFFQRLSYFFGCSTELEVLSVLQHALHPGDAFLDGGANIGLMTLSAAGWVGPRGRVDAFEPMPAVFEHLAWHIRTNNLRQVVLHRAGLSDREETLTVQVPGWDNWGAGTLGPIPPRFEGQVRLAGAARSVRGDDVLESADTRALFIKLDVEGFETRAVRGLSATIRRRLPAVLTEVNHEMLVLNGTSYLELSGLMTSMGYGPWAVDRAGFRSRHRLWLHPLRIDQVWMDKDVLWLHPKGPHWERLRPYFQPPGRYWLHHRYEEARARGEVQ